MRPLDPWGAILSGLVAITTGTSVLAFLLRHPGSSVPLARPAFSLRLSRDSTPRRKRPCRYRCRVCDGDGLSLVEQTCLYAFVGLSVEVLVVTAPVQARYTPTGSGSVVSHRSSHLWGTVPFIGLGCFLGDPLRCLVGAVLMGLTYPVFWVWQKRSASSSPLSS